jgi:CheY-like chemotaxis protein
MPTRNQQSRVLLVDDEPAIRKLLGPVLEKNGYDPPSPAVLEMHSKPYVITTLMFLFAI